MNAPYFAYWGKADPQLGGHHLAAFHMLDVAAVAEVLLARSLVLRRKLARAFSLTEDTLAPTLCALVAAHDLGKLDVAFQMKAPEAAVALAPERAGLPRMSRYDHGAGGYQHAARADGPLYAVVKRTLDASRNLDALRATTGHHGELPRVVGAARAPGWSAPAEERRDDLARAAFVEELARLFTARGATLPLRGASATTKIVWLAGLCSVADWVGSDSDHFAYLAQPRDLAAYYTERALPAAERALAAHGLLPNAPQQRSFAELYPQFPPRDVQRTVDALALAEGPSLTFIEAQMGRGKSEAAVALAQRHLARGDASGVYFALPTMATANALFERALEVAPRMYDHGPRSVVLAHGKRQHNEAFQRVLEGRVPRNPYDDEATLVCARWLLGRKRALLAQLGVGTVDQAMHAALRADHFFVRLFGLAQSVVLVDEAHAYDVYMEAILERLFEWLGALRAPVVVLSATLPFARKQALAAAWERGLRGLDEDTAPRELPRCDAYPLVTVVDEREVRALPGPPCEDRVLSLELRHEEPGLRDALLEALVQSAARGARVVWVRNTVREAQEAFAELASRAAAAGVEATLFHARLRAVDRTRRERATLERFGRVRAGGGAVLVATQVVEQSLDLDFDWMVTDLAPIDLLLQRSGRVHRHERPREARCGHEAPRLTVVLPAREDLGALRFGASGRVYDPVTLRLTADLLAAAPTLALPSRLRALVEAVYDPAQRAQAIAAHPLAARLTEVEEALRVEARDRAARAKQACVPPVGASLTTRETGDDDDDALAALTRDGASTTLWLLRWDGDGVARALEPGDDARVFSLDADGAQRWREARAVDDELLSVPSYPWEVLEKGLRARGEAAEWETFAARAEQFCRELRLGAPLLVPMRRRADGVFHGAVGTDKGAVVELRYSASRGLEQTRVRAG